MRIGNQDRKPILTEESQFVSNRTEGKVPEGNGWPEDSGLYPIRIDTISVTLSDAPAAKATNPVHRSARF